LVNDVMVEFVWCEIGQSVMVGLTSGLDPAKVYICRNGSFCK